MSEMNHRTTADDVAPNGHPGVVARSVEYDYDAKGNIVLPTGAPFDGEPVLIMLAAGWCEARWEGGRRYETQDGTEYEGFEWVCMDGNFSAELDDAKWWVALPAFEALGLSDDRSPVEAKPEVR